MAFDIRKFKAHYGDANAEATACREDVALFDFSFMSRGTVSGPRAGDVLARLISRPLTDMDVGAIRYCLREAEDGHLLADLTVWRTDSETFEVMSGRPDDIEDLVNVASELGQVAYNLTDESRIFALQGPQSFNAIKPMLSPHEAERLANLNYFRTMELKLASVPVRIGRLGYTGERGFELIVPANEAVRIWSGLAERARPAGFIAADMLRIEAGFVLFVNEFVLPVGAHEVGLAGFSTSNFSSTSLQPEVELIAFTAKASCDVELFQPPATIQRPKKPGELTVTSACGSVQAKGVLGLGYALKERNAGCSFHDPNGQFVNIRNVTRPYFDPEKKRPRGPWC
ncbi:MAG: hypothetical protein KDJ45_08900 [Hyphomicrobiaceae bacterium]|nr:hypothetical protein [Hyphomicrobiaceae bacterium]MCC0010802.1 hypothetical protein [Hyphomicrobiaceae bacterium]